MKDQDFEKIMDAWADHETESAPEMHPTADMYRMIQARKKREPSSLFYSRWALLGAGLASLVAFAVLYTLLSRPSTPSDSRPDQVVALVAQREGFASEKGVILKGPEVTPGKGEKRGPIAFKQLLFHFQTHDSRFVEGVDLQAPPEETVTLTSADNYRLLIEPAEDRYVYVFQLTSSDVLVKLFPNETYSSVQNPLHQGQTYPLPSKSNWFYLDDTEGEERLYVIASAGPRQDLEDLYARYSQADDASNKQELLAGLRKQVESIAETRSEKATGWVLVFNHQ